MTTIAIIGGVALLLGLWVMGTYNGLVRLRNAKDEGWSGIDVQLRRRFDLIPNLIETVKGYAAHEKSTLQNVTEARAAISKTSGDSEARMKAENALTSTLRSLFAVSENYPDLKANQNFLNLQEQLSAIEGELQMSRRYYNGTARDLNNKIQQFPAVMIAGPLGFTTARFFEADDTERQAPKVSF